VHADVAGQAFDAHSQRQQFGHLFFGGFALFEFTRRRFAVRWGDVQGEIEAAIRAREAA